MSEAWKVSPPCTVSERVHVYCRIRPGETSGYGKDGGYSPTILHATAAATASSYNKSSGSSFLQVDEATSTLRVDMASVLAYSSSPSRPNSATSTRQASSQRMRANGESRQRGRGTEQSYAPQLFSFDGLISDELDNVESFMETTALDLLENGGLLGGTNTCILCYGQQGSGKSSTAFGDLNHRPGIAPCVVQRLFALLAAPSSARWVAGMTFTLSLSMVLLHGDYIADLLSGVDGAAVETTQNEKPIITMNLQGNVIVRGIRQLICQSSAEALSLLQQGLAARAANPYREVGHVVFTIFLNSESVEAGSGRERRTASLRIADLAYSSSGSPVVDGRHGSRRTDRPVVKDSLSALRQVLLGLAEAAGGDAATPEPAAPATPSGRSRLRRPAQPLPYRQSKLTMLLKGYLGGRCRTVMVVHVRDQLELSGGALDTLQLAKRIMCVAECPAVNARVDPQLQLRRLQDHLEQMRAELRLQTQISTNAAAAMETMGVAGGSIGGGPAPSKNRLSLTTLKRSDGKRRETAATSLPPGDLSQEHRVQRLVMMYLSGSAPTIGVSTVWEMEACFAVLRSLLADRAAEMTTLRDDLRTAQTTAAAQTSSFSGPVEGNARRASTVKNPSASARNRSSIGRPLSSATLAVPQNTSPVSAAATAAAALPFTISHASIDGVTPTTLEEVGGISFGAAVKQYTSKQANQPSSATFRAPDSRPTTSSQSRSGAADGVSAVVLPSTAGSPISATISPLQAGVASSIATAPLPDVTAVIPPTATTATPAAVVLVPLLPYNSAVAVRPSSAMAADVNRITAAAPPALYSWNTSTAPIADDGMDQYGAPGVGNRSLIDDIDNQTREAFEAYKRSPQAIPQLLALADDQHRLRVLEQRLYQIQSGDGPLYSGGGGRIVLLASSECQQLQDQIARRQATLLKNFDSWCTARSAATTITTPNAAAATATAAGAPDSSSGICFAAASQSSFHPQLPNYRGGVASDLPGPKRVGSASRERPDSVTFPKLRPLTANATASGMPQRRVATPAGREFLAATSRYFTM